MSDEKSRAIQQPIKAANHRPRIAMALEYPLMQQGGTEVLVRELLRRLSERYELLLVSGDSNPNELPEEFRKRIRGHLTWDPKHAGAGAARELAENVHRQGVQVAHFHFGGTYEWRSNRLNQCPVYH